MDGNNRDVCNKDDDIYGGGGNSDVFCNDAGRAFSIRGDSGPGGHTCWIYNVYLGHGDRVDFSRDLPKKHPKIQRWTRLLEYSK